MIHITPILWLCYLYNLWFWYLNPETGFLFVSTTCNWQGSYEITYHHFWWLSDYPLQSWCCSLTVITMFLLRGPLDDTRPSDPAYLSGLTLAWRSLLSVTLFSLYRIFVGQWRIQRFFVKAQKNMSIFDIPAKQECCSSIQVLRLTLISLPDLKTLKTGTYLWSFSSRLWSTDSLLSQGFQLLCPSQKNNRNILFKDIDPLLSHILGLCL